MRPPLVTGNVSVEAAPASGADALLFGPGERPQLLAAGVTDAAGAFALEPVADGLPEAGTLVVKLKGDPVGALAQDVELPLPAPVSIEADGPFYAITGTIESDAGYPEELTLALEPVRLDGVPDRLWPFLNQKAAGVFDGRYFTRSISGQRLAVRVQPGVWRIAAEFIDHNRVNMPAPDFRNYVAAAARREPDGERLPGTPHGGFELEVDADRAITLVLREVQDEEL